MEYQKIANLLNDESNKPSKFRTRNWIEINDESRGTYSSNDIKFKATMLRPNLCDYADAYILVKGTITITGNAGPAAGRTEAQSLTARQADERNKGVIIRNCAPFTKCISRVNNTDIMHKQSKQYRHNAQDINIVMPMFNLIEYCDN